MCERERESALESFIKVVRERGRERDTAREREKRKRRGSERESESERTERQTKGEIGVKEERKVGSGRDWEGKK